MQGFNLLGTFTQDSYLEESGAFQLPSAQPALTFLPTNASEELDTPTSREGWPEDKKTSEELLAEPDDSSIWSAAGDGDVGPGTAPFPEPPAGVPILGTLPNCKQHCLDYKEFE